MDNRHPGRRRRYVSVRCVVDPDGQPTPLAVLWEPGREFVVTKVVSSASHACAGTGRGRRYEVWIGSHWAELYWDGRRWYVYAKPARKPEPWREGAAASS